MGGFQYNLVEHIARQHLGQCDDWEWRGPTFKPDEPGTYELQVTAELLGSDQPTTASHTVTVRVGEGNGEVCSLDAECPVERGCACAAGRETSGQGSGALLFVLVILGALVILAARRRKQQPIG
jgi:hypothetical protein